MTVMRAILAGVAAGGLMSSGAACAKDQAVSPTGMSAVALARAMERGDLTSEQIVRAALDRIEAIDKRGPAINAVIALMPDALDQARASDAARAAGHVRGPLEGIPVLIKDNVEVAGPVPTTAGSLALAANVTNRDAPLVARLRAAGAVILGKTNLSEWANFRSDKSTSGWSAVGGLTRNPWALDRNACGSSSGSGAAVAADEVPLAIGSETDGSITCPAAINGIVGFKPTVGMISRTHIVPISVSQDTAGPMGRSVGDVALLLMAAAGSDPADPATADADRYVPGLASAFAPGGLTGVRVGVLRGDEGDDPAIKAVFEQALTAMRRAGAILVDIADDGVDGKALGEAENVALQTEFKAGIASYLGSLPAGGKITARTLADLIAFNKATPAELHYFDQSIFEQSEARGPMDGDAYRTALATKTRLAGAEGIDRLLAANHVALLVQPSYGTAWLSTLGQGDHIDGPSASTLPAVAGYPHLTVPMGMVRGLPVGVSFIGTRWDDARVLRAGMAYEAVRGPFGSPTFAAHAP